MEGFFQVIELSPKDVEIAKAVDIAILKTVFQIKKTRLEQKLAELVREID